MQTFIAVNTKQTMNICIYIEIGHHQNDISINEKHIIILNCRFHFYRNLQKQS